MVPTILAFGFMALMTVHEIKNEPKAAQIQNEPEKEFKAIPSLPGARSSGYNASHKSTQSLVSCNYQTGLPYPEIRAFCDAELARRGWTFYEEQQMKDWGRDLGGKSARYCKEGYRADLQYAGTQADYGWDFAFSVSWGLDAVFEKRSDIFLKAGCK